MKSFSGKIALAVAAAALFATATNAQTPSGAAVHHGIHHTRHAYHTGTAHSTAIHNAIHNQAAANDASYASYGAGGYVSQAQPLYDVYNAAVMPMIAPGVACVGGVGHGYYPNPVSYDESAAVIQSGGQFNLERGYPGCFAVFGE